MSACPPVADSTAGRRWNPPRPSACLQLGSRRPPLHRLRQPYEQGRRPYDSGLVLIVASDREIRRNRLRRLFGVLLTIGAAATLAVLSLHLRAADDEVFAGNASPAATVYGLSEQLEVRPVDEPALDEPRRSLALRLEHSLRQPTDRGY